MKRNIKLGIAGCGWIVENAHLSAFQKIDDVEIISFFDIDIKKTRDLADKYSTACCYDNYDAFLQSDIDAVVIATPNYTHAGYSLKALQRAKHVLCEKPIAFKAWEVTELILTSQAVACCFIPGFVNRFRDDVQLVNDCIISGEIGKITHIKAGWLRRAGIPRPGTWFTHKKYSGGGVLIDLGSHMADLCLLFAQNSKSKTLKLSTYQHDHLLPEKSAAWFASFGTTDLLEIDVEDTATAMIELENDARVTLNLSWSASSKGDCTFFEIEGEKGRIILNTLLGFSDDRLWENDSIVIHQEGQKSKQVCLNNHPQTAFDRMAKYFVQSVRRGEACSLKAADGFHTVSIIDGLYCTEHKEDQPIVFDMVHQEKI